ncbi:MAG: PHP domain-containing protein [Candidatus Hydrogenedentes bacterium]|nr:PHP domain-containing protein [Candidatus Hydrogenedentota bacterium]
MRRLKADLHSHSADDPYDRIAYSTEMLIDTVAGLGYDVLAVTCHDAVVYSKQLADYAARRGVVFVPGIERRIEGKHVLILNPDEEQAKVRTFAELRALGKRRAAVIAPHPFYPTPRSLWKHLARNIDLFDAIEYCSLYSWGLNPNRLALRAARKAGLPMVGTSDVHQMPYCDTTFTWLECEPTVEGVVEAIRAGRAWYASRPRSTCYAAWAALNAARGMIHNVANP